MVIPALASARRDASTWPSPQFRRKPETPVAMMRASGVTPSSAALVSDMTTTAAAPSLSGQQLPAVATPSGTSWLQLGDGVVGHTGAGSVVSTHDGAVGAGSRV